MTTEVTDARLAQSPVQDESPEWRFCEFRRFIDDRVGGRTRVVAVTS